MTSSLKPRGPTTLRSADALRHRVFEGTGEPSPVLRQTVAASATGGPPAPPPYDELARRIGEAAYRTAMMKSIARRSAAPSYSGTEESRTGSTGPLDPLRTAYFGLRGSSDGLTYVIIQGPVP